MFDHYHCDNSCLLQFITVDINDCLCDIFELSVLHIIFSHTIYLTCFSSELDKPNVVFLSLARQRELNYNIEPLLSEGSYGRKTIGYLYAIQVTTTACWDL